MFARNSTVKSRRNTEIGGTVVRATVDIPTPVPRSKGHGHQRPLNAVTENQPYLWNGKAYELQAWYMDGIR